MNKTSAALQAIGVVDYINAYKKLKNLLIDEQAPAIRVAILSSFTLRGFKETLFVKCSQLGIAPHIYVGGYNQYAQEILNDESSLYKFDPNLIIVFIDVRTLMGEYYLSPYLFSDKQRRKFVDEKLVETTSLIKSIKTNSNAKILFHNFELPMYSPLGILENKEAFGLRESVEAINGKLRDCFKRDRQVYIFDYETFCSKFGKRNITNDKLYYLGHLVVDLEYIPNLCDEYLSYIKPIVSKSRKCIVLDLDNTLWGGIVGEDGFEGIKLGPTPEGRSFFELQKYLLSLFNRGIILAINSRNNLDDALKVFREHPYSILKEEHFASVQINWQDKISNMKAIAEELNIGLDSLVFVDDDVFNRELVKSALREVLVIDLPDDPSLYLRALMEISDLNTLQITAEDKEKGKIYAQQRKRSEFRTSTTDLNEYLKGLAMTVTIEAATKYTIPRISQLTQKTNQFNLTTRRYLEEDITRIAEGGDYIVASMQVRDKFGDNGITGAVIVEKSDNFWRIDTFLLSCRVIGRRIEEVLLAYVLHRAKNEGVRSVIGEFIRMPKNSPAQTFYKDNGFVMVGTKQDVELWENKLLEVPRPPDFIEVIQK